MPLELTPFGTNTTNRTTSPIYSIPIGKKPPYLTQLTRPTELSTGQTESPTRPTDPSKQKVKVHVPADPESDSSLSDSASRKYDSANDSNYSKSKRNKRDTKKKRRKHNKWDLSYSSSSDSDPSDDSDYRRKQRKNKSHQK